MWTFDLIKEIWSPASLKSSVAPSPRSEFAHSRYLDDFIIFGGRGDTDLYNDIYRYNILDNEWELVSVESSPKPSARRAACMAAADDFIVIYGGVEASGYSDELWKFDWGTKSYTPLISSNPPPKSAFSQCHIDRNSDNELIFKVYMGEIKGETPILFYYEYNLAKNSWVKIYNSRGGSSKSTNFLINDTIIGAGGDDFYHSSKTVFSYNVKSEEIYFTNLPVPYYYAANVHYKNKIYIHGGGYSFGTLPLRSIVKNDLIVINLNENCEESKSCIPDCSKGSYFENGICNLCPKGSFSDRIGSTSCEQCKIGYFSDIIGAETSKSCKPCPNGYFNTKEGESICMQCPEGSICSLDEAKPEYELDTSSTFSIQPDLLDYQSETVAENSRIFYIIISMILLLFTAFLLTCGKSYKFLKRIDIYSKKHNFEEGQPITVKKTLIGGMFTTIFIFAALGIIFNIFLSYAIDNIREIKALVPLAALEKQYDNFAAEVVKFEFEFKAYGGKCDSDQVEFAELFDINMENIKGIREYLILEKVDSDCKISFNIRNFELTENGKVNIQLSEPQSFSSAISLKIETSSSIPDEVSSISESIWSDKDQLFRGSIPSTFSYLMTPSLFKTDSKLWEDNQTGYHISVEQDPVKGSQSYAKDIQYSKNLKVEVLFYKNWAVLYSQRLQTQPIGTLLSNLSGSILGILGALGFIMTRFEKIHMKYSKIESSKIDIKQLKLNREDLISKNFNFNYTPISTSNPTQISWGLDWFRHRLSSKVHDEYLDKTFQGRIEQSDFNFITN